MHALDVLLFLGVFCLFAFITLFVSGALIHLAAVGKEVLRPMGRVREAKAETGLSTPTA